MIFNELDGQSVFLGILIGTALGAVSFTVFFQWAVRCKNCCWNDEETK